MILFFGIMLQISIDPRKMGRYLSYFVDYTMIHLGHGYSVQLRGYYAWEKDVMTLIRFKYKCSAFHPEAGTSFCREKLHQLRYFIFTLNDMKKNRYLFLGIMVILTRKKIPQETGTVLYVYITQINRKIQSVIFHLGRCQVLFNISY